MMRIPQLFNLDVNAIMLEHRELRKINESRMLDVAFFAFVTGMRPCCNIAFIIITKCEILCVLTVLFISLTSRVRFIIYEREERGGKKFPREMANETIVVNSMTTMEMIHSSCVCSRIIRTFSRMSIGIHCEICLKLLFTY